MKEAGHVHVCVSICISHVYLCLCMCVSMFYGCIKNNGGNVSVHFNNHFYVSRLCFIVFKSPCCVVSD